MQKLQTYKERGSNELQMAGNKEWRKYLS